MKLVIGCDADGILTNLSEHNLREGKKVYQKEVRDTNAYSLEEMYNLEDVPKFKLYTKAFKIFYKYCKKEPPREGVVETFSTLDDEEYEFHSITARKFANKTNILGVLSRKWFKGWIKKHDINFKSIQFCSEEKSPEDKLLACRKLCVDVMIEDKPEIALFLAQNGIKVIMINAPYNMNTVHENIIHVDNWNQVKRELKLLKKQKEYKKEVEFKKKDRDVVNNYSDEKKINYFDSYKKYLKKLDVNEESFKKKDRKFKLIYSMIKYPVKAFYRVKIFGKENIPYQNGFIIASNHNDSSDQYSLGLALGNRPFVGLAAKEVEDTFRGKLLKATGLGIFVDRNNPESRKESSEIMENFIAHDRIGLIFPEGTRKNKDEEGRARFQNRFKLGSVSMAQKTGAAILPTSIVTIKNKTLVRFGELFFVNPTDELVEVNKKLESTIAGLSMESIREYYTSKNELDKLKIEEEKYNSYLNEVYNDEFKKER